MANHVSTCGCRCLNNHVFTEREHHYLPSAERGAFAAVSPIDGKERQYGYDAVGDVPLVIITGMDRKDALVDWHGRAHPAVVEAAGPGSRMSQFRTMYLPPQAPPWFAVAAGRPRR
ncbi:hypothetical protein [Massilia sp. TWR1-2-2]|uniref:hypothetical protein n=1 Tax=Massilia sp. TWR1-2-2 TaxID=2804584 RepID=UPI003CEF2B95